jgi:predicted enzyme related to lactoylglutathione lyase
MSASSPPVGSISWFDLTVPDAPHLRAFYEAVVGWTSTPLDMDGYDDFCMNIPADGKTVAGICHARGENSNLPAQWLLYITVADVEESARQCVQLGGKVLVGPREMGGQGRVAVIQDPAGAVAALFQHAKEGGGGA